MPYEYGPVNKKMVETGDKKLSSLNINATTSPLPKASGQPYGGRHSQADVHSGG